MEPAEDSAPHMMDASRRVVHQAFVVFENRLQLFMVELQQERDQIFRAFIYSVCVAIFVLLTGVAFTALVAAVCWNWSPVAALAILVVAYAGVAVFFYVEMNKLRRDWQSFSSTFDELRKDRECLEKSLK